MKLSNLIPNFVKNQPVRTFALICVAITSAYIMYMGYWIMEILSSPGWCNRTLAADKIVKDSSFDALSACIGLLTIQLKAVAQTGLVYAGTLALCLLALMVIVVAGGHLSFTGPGGTSANMGGGPGGETPEGKAAKQVAGAAATEAANVVAAAEPHGAQMAPGEDG